LHLPELAKGPVRDFRFFDDLVNLFLAKAEVALQCLFYLVSIFVGARTVGCGSIG